MGFDRAARRERGRIEIEHNRSLLQRIGEREGELLAAERGLRREIGRRRADRKGRIGRRRTNVGSDEPVISGLAGRYATAIFELAQEEKSIDARSKKTSPPQGADRGSPDLYRLVKAPVFSRDEQKKGMDALLRRMEAAP
jgi:hypothetical protein